MVTASSPAPTMHVPLEQVRSYVCSDSSPDRWPQELMANLCATLTTSI